MTISKSKFGIMPDGRDVWQYTLSVPGGISVDILTFGAVIRRLMVLDKQGQYENCVLGFETLDAYMADTAYIGRMIGRVAGRISGSRFSIDGQDYTLTPNEGVNHLHGGPHGLHQVLWDAEIKNDAQGREALHLSHQSADGTDGYPGTVQCELIFSLAESHALNISMRATTDTTTPISLTRHEYFNLGLVQERDILGHHVQLYADQYTLFSEDLTPTGAIAPVKGTALDLGEGALLGDRCAAYPEVLAKGYDHYFVLEDTSEELRKAAQVSCPRTGRVLEVLTNQPGLVFYSGGYLPGTPYEPQAGLCLEPQGFPDAVNQPAFSSVHLKPGETYRHDLSYRFSCTSA